jgi:hypothetical protein
MSEEPKVPDHIEMPAPTVWPLVTALGVTLTLAGLITHVAVSMVGLILLIRGAIGWWHEVLPRDREIAVPVRPPENRHQPIKVSPREVVHLKLGEAGHRVRIPAEVYPWQAGLKGGAYGMVVMAIAACVWGWFQYGSIWYPINLLAATCVSSLSTADEDVLRQFSLYGLMAGTVIHVGTSLLVGWIYAVALPMFPKHPLLFGGVFAPMFWSAVLYATMSSINPALAEKVDWGWFIVCQFIFGMTAGYVVKQEEKIETMQTWPLAVRAGVEARMDVGAEPKKETEP